MNAIGHFDLIFGSCDRKSQNQEQSDCADSCLVSSCENSKYSAQ